MEKTTVLFAGPSLYGLETKKYKWIDIYGPACQSDIYSILNHKLYRRIILADGLYKSIPAPWHKEILMALEMNIEVYGVASLGALRAAELDVYGMEGSGKIYDYIRSNVVDDSEVAVVHKPKMNKWEAMTLAHVEIKYWSEEMRKQKKITNETYEHIINWSKRTHFERRTKKGLIKELSLTVNAPKALVDQTWFSQKQQDLAKLLENLDSQTAEQNKSRERDWNLANTPYIYRQISKDTSLLPILDNERDHGDILVNFIIFVFLKYKKTFQEILLKVYIEYIQMELARLDSQKYVINNENFFRLYSEKACFLLRKQFAQEYNWIDRENRENYIKNKGKIIGLEFKKLNKEFRPISNISKHLIENLYGLVEEHKKARSTNINDEELLSKNMVEEMNKTVLTSLMKGEDIDIEARKAIYCSKQLMDSCSVYTHHGRLRMYAILSNDEIYDEIIEKWEKVLMNKRRGKPHAFYNEEIDLTRLKEKIKKLNQEIREIQPFPVDNITETIELLFLEADSIAVIDYTLEEG